MHKIYKILRQFSFNVYKFRPDEIILSGKTFFNNTNLGHNIDYNNRKFNTTIRSEIYRNIKTSNIFSNVYGFKLV